VDAQGERRREVVRTALLGAAVFGLVFLIALGSGRSLASAGGGSVGFSFRPASGDATVLIIAFGAVALTALAYLVWVVFPGRRGKSEEPGPIFEHPPIPWWSKLLLVLLALPPAAGIAAVVKSSAWGPCSSCSRSSCACGVLPVRSASTRRETSRPFVVRSTIPSQRSSRSLTREEP
jgi:hypothetical protein